MVRFRDRPAEPATDPGRVRRGVRRPFERERGTDGYLAGRSGTSGHLPVQVGMWPWGRPRVAATGRPA